jgi:hypothetical protein
MTAPGKMSFEERERCALKIYNSRIRPLLKPADGGKFIRIDVLSGDYEIGESSVDTGRALRARQPNAIMHTICDHRSYVKRFRSHPLIGRETDSAQ